MLGLIFEEFEGEFSLAVLNKAKFESGKVVLKNLANLKGNNLYG